MGAPVAKSNGMGVAALVLGILSILGGLFVVGGILGVLAVIFGFVGRGRAKRGEADNGGMALAGIITGIIGILLSVLILVLAVFLVSSDGFKSFTECINDADGDQAKIEKCELDF